MWQLRKESSTTHLHIKKKLATGDYTGRKAALNNTNIINFLKMSGSKVQPCQVNRKFLVLETGGTKQDFAFGIVFVLPALQAGWHTV